MESRAATECGIQEPYAGLFNKASDFLIARYPFLHLFSLMLKVFSGSNCKKKTKKQFRLNRDAFFRGLAGPLLNNLNFQKFWSLDFKSG